jgi:hypothetical protein
MKGLKLIIILVNIVALVFFIFTFQQMKQTKKLEALRQEKQKVILDASTAKKKLAKLTKELEDLREAAKFSKKMILSDESGVLDAVRELSRLATSNRLQKVEFAYVTNYDMLSGANINTDLSRSYGLKNAKAVFISVNLEVEYKFLEVFLKEVYALKTTLSVEHLAITREDGLLPRQKVFLVLAAYMY